VILTALLFSRYRAFREATRLDFAPLTVIIGKNGGGKSVLTRLPLLIAGGLAAQAEASLDLTAGGISHAARYEDLIYQRSAQPFSLGAEISDGNRTLRFVTTIRHVAELCIQCLMYAIVT
jgi:recombinational DNA repair ATPase RecF